MITYSDPLLNESRLVKTPSVMRQRRSASVMDLHKRHSCYCGCSKAGTLRTIERTKRPVHPRGSIRNGAWR